jgi:hypothetical protein
MGLFPVVLPVGEGSVGSLNFGTMHVDMLGSGLSVLGVGLPVDTVWPGANRAVFMPFSLVKVWYASACLVRNGTVVSGNVDVGIYSPFSRRICSNGGAAQVGVNANQQFNFPYVRLEPGQYFLALSCDNVVARFLAWTLTPADLLFSSRMLESSASYPLPLNPVMATPSVGVVPIVELLFVE